MKKRCSTNKSDYRIENSRVGIICYCNTPKDNVMNISSSSTDKKEESISFKKFGLIILTTCFPKI